MATEPNPHPNIYAALAAFQAELPSITKEHTAKVKTKTGADFSYAYADLASVAHTVLPLLGKQGIAWVAVPTLEDGKLLLRYGLYHGISDTSVEGVYPLVNGTPQEVGSAITYARRYGLLALTGTFPAGEDDDGAAAQIAGLRSTRPQATEGGGPMHMPSPPDPPSPPVDPALVRAAIEDANDFEALREVYRRASRAKQLDVVLDTGEAVRDAITSRRLLLEAKEEAEKAETEAATPEQATPEERTADKVTAALEAEREQAVAEALDKIGQRE